MIEKLAWEVIINDMGCIVFALTKAKATWTAVHSYWDAGYGRQGTWPARVNTKRAERYDQSLLRGKNIHRAWIEEYVADYPTGVITT